MITTWSDAALCAAGQTLVRQLAQQLPQGDGVPISPAFQRKMAALLRRTRRRQTVRTACRRTAAALLTVALVLGAVLAVSPTARAAVSGWLRRTTTRDGVTYRFSGQDAAGGLPEDMPWLPEGYSPAQDLSAPDGVRVLRCTAPQGDLLFVTLRAAGAEPRTVTIRPWRTSGLQGPAAPPQEEAPPEGCAVRELSVCGRSAQLYTFLPQPHQHFDGSFSLAFFIGQETCPFYHLAMAAGTSALVWVDEDAGLLRIVTGGGLTESDLLHMAESTYGA